jgi:hypothetical protein
MIHDEILIENIDELELIECIKVFDEELKIFLNKTPDSNDVVVEKYTKILTENHPVSATDIQMTISKQGKKVALPFKEDFFDNYCYSNRKERDGLLKKVLDEIKDKAD